MLVIAIDTSGRNGSVALCRGDSNSFESLQLIAIEGGTYSARLMPCIAELLAAEHLDLQALDGFVVVSGPGSFTGLRVGISTVKGLCEVSRKPLVAVSMLQAYALLRAGQSDVNTVLLDAGRGEVYVGEFRVDAQAPRNLREYIARVDRFSADTASAANRVLTPDSKIADVLTAAGCRVELVSPLHADDIGRIGIARLLSGETDDPSTLDANYIRRSDAEIFSAPTR